MNNIKLNSVAALEEMKTAYLEKINKAKYQVLVCGGAGCISGHCKEMKKELLKRIKENGIEDKVVVLETGCMGLCPIGPNLIVYPDGIFYQSVDKQKVRDIVSAHLVSGKIIGGYTYFDEKSGKHIVNVKDIPFLKKQTKLVLRNCGVAEHDSLAAYVARGGYFSSAKALLNMSPQDVVNEVKTSGLQGRGGGGFPTGIKWQAGHDAVADQKYIVCNADEGNPGAYMDRSILEGDPHSVLEGMLIAGYAIGATKGVVYVRAEYPLAIERLSLAIEQARESGLFCSNVFGSGFAFDVEIRIGAGAFVCGEETSLLASVEGKRGEPKQKPPLPFEKGLYGMPTIINNVETFANIALIIEKSGAWYSKIGTEKCKGTKVYSLAGDLYHTGLIEVPLGTTLREIIYDIGGGIKEGKKFKAAQLGGPSGGGIPEEYLDMPIDYITTREVGAILGSGGVIIMSEDVCMVEMCKHFLDFTVHESCGKCLPCRVGTQRMREILTRITNGEGKMEDLDLLEELAETLQQTALCGLGQAAPAPVLSALRFFREEFIEHIEGHYCRAGVCEKLEHPVVNKIGGSC